MRFGYTHLQVLDVPDGGDLRNARVHHHHEERDEEVGLLPQRQVRHLTEPRETTQNTRDSTYINQSSGVRGV